MVEQKKSVKKKPAIQRKPAKRVINKKAKKKGFTLIELLAVIIILGVLMIIAIPAVTSYIQNSRKSAYISSAKEIIGGARILVNEGKLGMYDSNVSYYIPVSYIKTEGANKTPYGEYTEAYVVVTFNGTSYKYYWISTDTSETGVKDIISEDNLSVDNIESNVTSTMIHQTVTTTGIGSRTEIDILKSDGTWDTPIELADTSNNVPEEGSGGNNSSGGLVTYYVGYQDNWLGAPGAIGGQLNREENLSIDNPENRRIKYFNNLEDAYAESTLNSCGYYDPYENKVVIYDDTCFLNIAIKVVTENDIIKEAYVVFRHNGNDYYLRGGVTDTDIFNSNKDVARGAFGEGNCESSNAYYTCEGESSDDVYNRVTINKNNGYVQIESKGYVSVVDNEGCAYLEQQS